MNIGLLITELEDVEVKKVCIGAIKAAKEKKVNLFILPGKYLLSDTEDNESKYDYQYSALFDYASSDEFDALIIDVKRIGSKTTILKKEAFLKKFENIPFLTLTEQEGYLSVNKVAEGEYYFENLGYEAVCDIVFYHKNYTIPKVMPDQEFECQEENGSASLKYISEISSILFNRKYGSEKAYCALTGCAAKNGIRNSGIFLYDKKVKNTIKYPWIKSDHIRLKSAVVNGQEIDNENTNNLLSTGKILSTFSEVKNKVFIMGNIFVGEYQLGLFVSECNMIALDDNYFNTMMNVVTGISRISYLEKEIDKISGELYEVQEELARDDSVLDHIGDEDYLTGGLNRRGFFAKAYDHLKEHFTDGKYAIVAYIHMESLKRINEMFGHDEGDKALKIVSNSLEEVFEGSICGRIRGDEFAAIVVADEEGVSESLKEKMSEQNKKLFAAASRYIIHLQYSICEFSYADNLSLREMLKETDDNLKMIKGN